MNRLNKNLSKFLVVCLALTAALFAGSCNSWMSDDGFVDKIESEVHDANAAPISVYIRYANSKMGTTDPSGYTSMKVDVASEIAAVTSDDYGFVKWAAFSTTDFPASQQHSSLFYESAEAYAEKFAPLELPASEIVFSTPTEPTTTVKIYKERNDIFIIPIVAKRPTVVTSVPSNGRSDVVRNTSIRILFSKKIDPASVKDEFGNSNIVITSGSAVLTETSGELGAKDITQNCTITLGKTGKMLTISPNKGYYFDNNSQITVNIYEDVCDTDGYGMNGKYSFSFTTGVKLDSLAPRIETLWAAPDADFSENNRFEQYKYIITGETEPVFKTAADSASNDIADYVAEDADLRSKNKKEILTQRVKDYLNIYVQASDIAGAGANVTVDQNTTSESDVALIQIRACLYIDKDGNPVTTSAKAFAENTTVSSGYYLETKDIGYAPGLKDSDCRIQKTFEDVFTDANGQQTRNNGTLFTYDLRSLPDGLIKIDIWAVDMVGNSGETESYVKQEYNNNYRSIFVVKDTTKPDAAANKQFVVPSGNATADGYYNTTTYAGIKISGNTSIADAGNANLSSLNSKMKWIVKPTADTSWVNTISPNDNGWKFVTEDYSGFPTPASDGPVTLTYALMDDLGNISDAVQLDAIKYDGTNPT
ncbi:MAG: Ig-like domain-containing protein, partial [Lachnospiraceae bacterium]|nr:Ig-like domain-containing protein [Lachnospiraceae bacterium]